MTDKDKANYQKGIKTMIELLQLFHNSLDREAASEVFCSYCDELFPSRAAAMEHVSVCKKNPLVAEIERLRKELKERKAK